VKYLIEIRVNDKVKVRTKDFWFGYHVKSLIVLKRYANRNR